MRDHTIKEQFALVALNGLDSGHPSVVKALAVMGIEAAELLQNLFLYEEAEEPEVLRAQLHDQLFLIKKMNGKSRANSEKNIADILKAEEVLTEIPSLLGCDLNYDTANITLREYKCCENVYQTIIDSIRAVMLEPGEVPDEAICLAWLFRECGCLHDIFSVEEQNRIQTRMTAICSVNPFARVIWNEEFHSWGKRLSQKFSNQKHLLFKNPHLEGVNLIFPFFDRKQSVFISQAILGTTVKDRREAAMAFLRKCGHSCEELKIGEETVVKIDNSYYRIWPNVRVCKFPIQGVSLLPVYR